MNTYKIILRFAGALLALAMVSCREEDFSHQPIENDGVEPGTVSNTQVNNFPGGAIIQYSLPKDPDLLYVVARYSVNEETARETRASYHENQLSVTGFGRAGEYPVRLYAVDRSGNESEPVEVKVHPDTAAYTKTFTSLKMNSTFGGVAVQFENEVEGNVGIVLLAEDNNGELVPVDALYSSQREGIFSIRGYDTVARTFGVYVRDRWNNVSDTIVKSLTPLFEKELNRSAFTEYPLPDDAPVAFEGAGYFPERAWDGNVDKFAWHTPPAGVELPLQITFDLGVVAQLSRFKVWHRVGFEFRGHSPRKYAIWGRATPTNQPGYEGWTKLVDFESIKPSGLPSGINADDRAAAAAGEGTDFPADAPPVRYIRFQMFENWAHGVALNLGEVSFWGDY